MRLNVRFAGSGGQGVILASVLLSKAYGLGENYNIAQTQSYGPEARGGACKAEVVISDEDIDYMKVEEADVFVALNQVGYDKYINTVKDDAIVLINSTLVETDRPNVYRIQATKRAEDMGKPFVVNIIALGALTRLMPKIHSPAVEEEIKKNFNASIAGPNLDAYQMGYDIMDEDLKDLGYRTGFGDSSRF
ncbi:MAG: 2-oxoacid:acceptor oxidoreductase family protein [Eubacteriales bacterium]|nr:2-oxoacid:acceptor oxidoreductase family protein [Eubacteriales bacterium]